MKLKIAETIVPNGGTVMFHIYGETHNGLAPGAQIHCSHIPGVAMLPDPTLRPFAMGPRAWVELVRCEDGNTQVILWKDGEKVDT